jgi:16S rRNA (adenine1518-N6/adenine1519-N6)-dimethyltransferase
MVQEEVAQKIAASRANVSAITVFIQAYLDLQLLSKVGPEAFAPPPKVFSRTVYFCPRKDTPNIEDVELFWEFVRACFRHPRQTLRNNFKDAGFCIGQMVGLNDFILGMRAQHLKLADFLKIWHENRVLCSRPRKGIKELKKT